MKIAFWAVVVLFAGYATIAGLISFVFEDRGELCTTSTEGWRRCEWDWGAAAFSGFFLVLFALLLFFSSRSLIQAIQESGMVWRTEMIACQVGLVAASLVALWSFSQLWNWAVAPDMPCLAPNPAGSVFTDRGRFDEVECAGSAWWETLLPWIALLAALGVGAVSIVRLRHGRRRPQTPAADLGLAS
jgi:hypothetical protein